MGLDETDEDIDAIGAARAGALQHRIGLADAGRRAEKNAQLAARRGFRHGEQGVRIGAAIEVSLLRRQCRALTLEVYSSASSARFNISTFTRGSPKRPSARGSI